MTTKVMLASPAALAMTLLLLVPPTRADAGAPPRVVAFEDVNIIGTRPGQKKLRRHQTVIVKDGVIVQIGKKNRVEIPARARVIDGSRKYLLPGLSDMHVHLSFLETVPERMTPADAYTLLLANGVTTIQEMWGFDQLFAWRKQLDRGEVLGPRLHFASPAIRNDTVASVDDAEAKVRQWVERGYESIKIHDPITEQIFRRVHEVGRELGVAVIGHAARPGHGFELTVEEGQPMLAHVEELLWSQTPAEVSLEALEEGIAKQPEATAAAAEHGIYVTTTVIVQDVFKRTQDDDAFAEQLASPLLRYFPPSLRDQWENDNPNRDGSVTQEVHQRILDTHLRAIRDMRRLNSADRLLIGTDAGGPDLVLLGFSIHEELALAVRAGLRPIEAIRAATYNPAVFLGLEEISGSIDVGKRADLLLVRRNPSKRISRLQEAAGVMVRGQWLAAEDLQERLDQLAAKFD